MIKKILIAFIVCLAFVITTGCDDDSNEPVTITVNVDYTGAETVDASHKIYVHVFAVADPFTDGEDPLETGANSISSASGTVTFTPPADAQDNVYFAVLVDVDGSGDNGPTAGDVVYGYDEGIWDHSSAVNLTAVDITSSKTLTFTFGDSNSFLPINNVDLLGGWYHPPPGDLPLTRHGSADTSSVRVARTIVDIKHTLQYIINMIVYDWNPEKNDQLKSERGVSFEEIIFFIEKGNILAIVEHPNRERYPDQKMYIIEIDNYAYLVPFVKNNDKIFLKTIIPSRKATKIYLEETDEK